jgi:uncharacterized surface protein with fasciclin (FAS1) repeats
MADIARTAAAFGLFRVMLSAFRATQLESLLRSGEPVTALFAPDDAFGGGRTGPLVSAGTPQGPAWAKFLRLHLLPGAWTSATLAGCPDVATLQGESWRVERTSRLLLGGVAVIQADIRCDNGVIHILESPLCAPPL